MYRRVSASCVCFDSDGFVNRCFPAKLRRANCALKLRQIPQNKLSCVVRKTSARRRLRDHPVAPYILSSICV